MISMSTRTFLVFAVSRLDIDYLLGKEADMEWAVRALRTAGHEVEADC